jgi:hypothetical protein
MIAAVSPKKEVIALQSAPGPADGAEPPTLTGLIVTIDTEPDLPRRRQSTRSSFRNIPELRRLQERIPDIKLTLLITQSVLEDPASLREIERLRADFGCEIGAHLHPEDTPPFLSDEPQRRETSLMRLPFELRAEKLRTLVSALQTHFSRPTSYRAGRWQLSPEDFGMLSEQGFLVESSVTPYVSWQLEHGPDFSVFGPEPYPVNGTGLWEVPVTIGLNRGLFLARRGLVRSYLRHFSHPANNLRFPLDRLWAWGRPISPVWLRPTYTPLGALKRLGRSTLRRYTEPVLNMMFHSNELVVGGRPFIRRQADVDRIVARIVGACTYFTRERGVRSTTLSDYARACAAVSAA